MDFIEEPLANEKELSGTSRCCACLCATNCMRDTLAGALFNIPTIRVLVDACALMKLP